jgi:peptidoglycan/xylan/chitin deacetylase (PgdA/CDA1 family)
MIWHAVKQIAAPVLSARPLVPANRRVIFIYHDVSHPGSAHFRPEYSTPPDVFREQIDCLVRHFDLVSLAAITRPDTAIGDRPRAAITFDDGFRGVRSEALPILEPRGIPFAVFVSRMAIEKDALYNGPSNQLVQGGRSRVFLDAEDVIALSRAGVTIGNHSATHRNLALCSAAQLDEEIAGNKHYLEGLLGVPIRDFAFPIGSRQHCTEPVIQACFAAGHERGYSADRRLFRGKDVTVARARNELFPRVGLKGESPGELLFAINRALLRGVGRYR